MTTANVALSRRGWWTTTVRPRIHVVVLVVALLVGGLAVGGRLMAARADSQSMTMPTSAQVESTLGVRFTRVAVVGDGGLVVLSYTVLDPEKATQFTAKATNLPVLTNEATGESTHHISLMRIGHALTAGQTYYWVYNDGGVLRSGSVATISALGVSLTGVPVQ